MISVSSAWKEAQKQLLAPESFVEISCSLTEIGVQEEATATGIDEAIFSDISAVPGTSGEQTIKKYATLETNLWVLDGTRNTIPTTEPYANVGYVCDIANAGSVTLTLPEVHTVGIPGITITWSSEYGEYATKFTVVAKNGETVIAETTVLDNTKNISLVYLDIANYDSVTVTVLEWSVPDHRSRIDLVRLGLDLTFSKSEIINYAHEQHGCILSGELPKNSIEFSVDNTSNRWNPNNPTGLERYLSERQRLTARYGLDINGTTEWIKAGTFYLSEWRAPSNGLEASFVARDILEYMINVPYTGIREGTLNDIANAAIEQADLPIGTVVRLNLGEPGNYTIKPFTENYSIAEVLQLCANAAGCAMYQDRNGKLRIEYRGTILSDYAIPSELSYSWPEIELTKNLKEVAVSYGEEGKYVLSVNDFGETQTVDNPLINSEEHAAYLANLVMAQLKPRKSITGEYRADPRLDLFDCISVDTKFGTISPVIVSNIKYSFSGAFRCNYTAKVWEG